MILNVIFQSCNQNVPGSLPFPCYLFCGPKQNARAPVSFGYAPPPPFSAIHSSLEKFHMKFPSTELSGNCHEERMMKIMDEISQDR